MKSAIAVIGTGRMGSALAGALLDAGYPTAVWNRTKERAEPLAARGATIAASVLEAVEGADVIIVNVSDYAAATAALRSDAVAAAIGGKLIVQLTSGTPDQARGAATWFQDHGAEYIDGAIMATPDFVGQEAGTILVSGASTAFTQNEDVFRALGGNIRHLGDDCGRANALDSALLSLMWGALFGTLTAIAVSQAEDIDLGELTRLWTATVPVVDGLVTDLIQRTNAGRFASDSDTLSTVAAHYGSFANLLQLMKARGLDLSVVRGYEVIFQRAVTSGQLQADFAALAQFMHEPAHEVA